eukprot:g46813.t1
MKRDAKSRPARYQVMTTCGVLDEWSDGKWFRSETTTAAAITFKTLLEAHEARRSITDEGAREQLTRFVSMAEFLYDKSVTMFGKIPPPEKRIRKTSKRKNASGVRVRVRRGGQNNRKRLQKGGASSPGLQEQNEKKKEGEQDWGGPDDNQESKEEEEKTGKGKNEQGEQETGQVCGLDNKTQTECGRNATLQAVVSCILLCQRRQDLSAGHPLLMQEDGTGASAGINFAESCINCRLWMLALKVTGSKAYKTVRAEDEWSAISLHMTILQNQRPFFRVTEDSNVSFPHILECVWAQSLHEMSFGEDVAIGTELRCLENLPPLWTKEVCMWEASWCVGCSVQARNGVHRAHRLLQDYMFWGVQVLPPNGALSNKPMVKADMLLYWPQNLQVEVGCVWTAGEGGWLGNVAIPLRLEVPAAGVAWDENVWKEGGGSSVQAKVHYDLKAVVAFANADYWAYVWRGDNWWLVDDEVVQRVTRADLFYHADTLEYEAQRIGVTSAGDLQDHVRARISQVRREIVVEAAQRGTSTEAGGGAIQNSQDNSAGEGKGTGQQLRQPSDVRTTRSAAIALCSMQQGGPGNSIMSRWEMDEVQESGKCTSGVKRAKSQVSQVSRKKTRTAPEQFDCVGSSCRQCRQPSLKQKHTDTCVKSKIYQAKVGKASRTSKSRQGNKGDGDMVGKGRKLQKPVGTESRKSGQGAAAVEIDTEGSEDTE